MTDRSPSLLVGSSVRNTTPHLNDIIGTCKNQQGGVVVKSECQQSVLSVGMAMGLAVVSPAHPGSELYNDTLDDERGQRD